jgi:hypothetical protein
MTHLASLFQPGQLQATWIYWVLIAVVLVDLVLVTRGLIRTGRSTRDAPGPWALPGPSRRILRASGWLSVGLSLLLGAALLTRMPVALWIAALTVLPPLIRFILNRPFAKTAEDIGGVIGALVGAALQTLVIMAGISSIDPASTFPLRLDQHLNEATP